MGTRHSPGCSCCGPPPTPSVDCVCPIPLTDLTLRIRTEPVQLSAMTLEDSECWGTVVDCTEILDAFGNPTGLYSCVVKAVDQTVTLAYGGENGTIGHYWMSACITTEYYALNPACFDGETPIDCGTYLVRYILFCLAGEPVLRIVGGWCLDGTSPDIPEVDCGDFTIDDFVAMGVFGDFTLFVECCGYLHLYFHDSDFFPSVIDYDITDPANPPPDFPCDRCEVWCPCEDEEDYPLPKCATLDSSRYGEFEITLNGTFPGGEADTGNLTVSDTGITGWTATGGCACADLPLITTGTVTFTVRYVLTYDCTSATLTKFLPIRFGSANPSEPPGPCFIRYGPYAGEDAGTMFVSDTISYTGCGPMEFNLPELDLPEGEGSDPDLCDLETQHTTVVGFTATETVTITPHTTPPP